MGEKSREWWSLENLCSRQERESVTNKGDKSSAEEHRQKRRMNKKGKKGKTRKNQH